MFLYIFERVHESCYSGLKLGADFTILQARQLFLKRRFHKNHRRNLKTLSLADPVNHAPARTFQKEIGIHICKAGGGDRQLSTRTMGLLSRVVRVERTSAARVLHAKDPGTVGERQLKSDEWLLIVLQHLLEDRSTSILELELRKILLGNIFVIVRSFMK